MHTNHDPRHRFANAKATFQAEHRQLSSSRESDRIFRQEFFIAEVSYRLTSESKHPCLMELRGRLTKTIKTLLDSYPVDHREWHCAEWAERIMNCLHCARVTVSYGCPFDGETLAGVTIANPAHFSNLSRLDE